MKKVLALITVMMVIAVMAGCQPEADQPPAPELDGKVIMITDTGGINDRSFNQSAWEGLQTLEDKYPNYEFDYILSNTETEYTSNIRLAVDNGSSLTWAVGYMLADNMDETAKALPDEKFGIIDVTGLSNPNLVQVAFKEHEGSFLVGVVAGMTTDKNKIGFIGGKTGDLIKKFEVGFRAGVKAVNPEATVDISYTESWTDTQIAKGFADAMYDQGIDIIYHASGNCGAGVFQSAKERGTGPEGFWTIGVDRDQRDEAPDNMLTSMFKNVGGAMAQVSEEYIKDGTFKGGEVIVLGLKENGVGLAPTSNETIPEDIRADVLAKVEEFKNKIVNDEIQVPQTEEEFEAWSIE